MRSFRIFGIALALIWLAPAAALLNRESSTGSDVLGRYTIQYAFVLAVYWLAWLGLIAFTYLARPPVREALLRPVRWFQRYPVLTFVLAYGLIELWAAVHWRLYITRFFGIGGDYVAVLTFVGLLEAYLLVALLIAGRTGNELRRVVRNAALALAAGAVLLVLFSWIAVQKSPGYFDLHTIYWKFHRLDPVLSYEGVPDQRSSAWPVSYYPSGPAYASTDQDGFRNLGPRGDAPVAMVGDSIVFGMGLNDEDAPARLLGAELGVEVANYGIIGYEPWQYNLVIDRYFRDASHNLLIYVIYADDLRADDPVISAERRWEMLPFRSPIHYTLYHAFEKGSPTRWLVQTLGGWLRPSADQPGEPPLPYDLLPVCSYQSANFLPEVTPAYLRDRLDRAIALSEEIGFRLLIVTLPSREVIYAEELASVCPTVVASAIDNETSTFDSLCAYAQAREVPCYNMVEDFRAGAHTHSNVLHDGHLTPEGSAFFAARIADAIRTRRLLPGLAD